MISGTTSRGGTSGRTLEPVKRPTDILHFSAPATGEPEGIASFPIGSPSVCGDITNNNSNTNDNGNNSKDHNNGNSDNSNTGNNSNGDDNNKFIMVQFESNNGGLRTFGRIIGEFSV